tara:strand:- start:4350 stop:5885 length:1536 start_codon:yes stop_codon:yes gene_type:complete
MNRHFKKFMPKLLLLAPILFSLLSCSKDADLLSDYVINKKDDISGVYSLLVNDTYFSDMKSSILLDVLNNDTFENFNNVTVVATTTPELGTVVINENNTLTYTPPTPPVVNETIATTSETQEEVVDTFVYTVEETSAAGDITTAEATVTVKIITVSEDVEYWKLKFDNQFSTGGDRAKMMALSKSGNKFQEYYYMYYYFDGLLSIWQATGDNKYLDIMLEVVNNTIKDAQPVSFNSTYLGWPSDSSYGLDYPKNGVALWESYYWKDVTTLLRIMYQSPNLLSNSFGAKTYQDEYEKLLAFTEKNIWEKWETKGSSNIYRTHTHMASHWARMGMELYLITGKNKYKTVFENISHGNMPNVPSNLRDRIRENTNVPGAYVWDMPFDVPPGSKVQDTSHAADIIGFWILAHENEMYWTMSDMEALVLTLDKVIFPANDGPRPYLNVDGTGGFDAPGRLRGWLKLGRYNKDLQNKLINEYQSDLQNSNRYAILNLGVFALNERILADGYPVYPEN